uniref:hypothetical protein n=1 Tax=uncultured Sphingomonas sp. TaxID=158754 RepID=UPI0035C9C376
MTGDKSLAAAINDARALLDALLANNWHDAHVATAETEIFIAQSVGRANPMRITSAHSGSVPPVAAVEVVVKAPHVSTIVSIVAIGTMLEAGSSIARLRVLDEEHELLTERAGIVCATYVAPGDLVEFGVSVAGVSA